MSDFKSQFLKHLSSFGTLPYLFVGSGMSRRYLGIPTWSALLEEFLSKNMKLDKPFKYYLSLRPDNLPLLASDFAKTFHEIWWGEKEYEPSRQQYNSIAHLNTEMPLKIELSSLVASFTTTTAPELEHEILALKASSISGIITTNWDTFLSEIFTDFHTFIGQKELLFANSFGIGDIYKIHGCVTKPDSLVVTGDDYSKFNSSNAYLAAKLLTIFVEHPVIFLGYSLSDPNINEIIEAIVSCLDKTNIDKLKDRLIFVEWDKNADTPIFTDSVFKTQTSVLPIKLIKTKNFLDVYEVLGAITQKVPMKLLRKLKNSVYNLVKTDIPSKIFYYGNMSELKENEDLDVVLGVNLGQNQALQQGGLQIMGYHSPAIKDIIEDVLLDNKSYNSELLISEVFPKLLRGRPYCPIYKYLRASGLLSKDGQLTKAGKAAIQESFTLRQTPPSCFYPIPQYMKKQKLIRQIYKSLGDLIENETINHALDYIPLLDEKLIDLELLNGFLLEHFQNEEVYNRTSFKRLVCLYDYLKYAKEL
jgi:hypothetical protein